MSQIIEVKVPDIGDFSDVPVIDLFVKVGDTIKVDDAIATLESDKATMDVPSTVAGIVKEVLVQLGSKVSEGSLLIKVEAGVAAAAAPAAQAAAPAPAPASAAAGGGMVSVTVNGAFDVTKIKIEKDVVDPSDIGMLEDLVMSAVNAANARMREVTKQHMGKVMGGMNIPGMPGMF